MSRFIRTLLLALGVAVILAPPSHAQGAGRLSGRVVDGTRGTPLGGALIEVVGPGPAVNRSLTGVDGRYVLLNLSPGTLSLRIRMLGYRPKVVTDVVIREGGVNTQNITLDAESVQLEDITVSAATERGSVASALNEQRVSVNVVNAVTAEEIARSPDGDAATAMQRVSGVSVQDGRYISVRGLGQRYTVASLNGTRLPSMEPERKVVPLDLYPASMLEGITTAKTFTPDRSGDFSGGEVNIVTKTFPAERRFSLSLGSGVNSRATGQTLPRARRTGREWLAFGSDQRSLPSIVRNAGNFSTQPSQEEINQMVGAFRNSWSPRRDQGEPAGSFGVSLGGKDPVFGKDVGYLASFSYNRTHEIEDGQIRANAIVGDTPGTQREVDMFEGTTGRESVLWGGLLTLSTDVGTSSRVTLNTTYNRSADSEGRRELGESENLGGRFEVLRQRYVERSTLSGQLGGEHRFGLRHQLDWKVSASRVTRDEPDRSEFVFQLDTDPFGSPLPPAWFSLSNEGAVRTFAELDEESVQGALDYRVVFGPLDRPHALKVGGLVRRTTRNADNQVFSLSASLDRASRELSPEEIFDGRFSQPGSSVFRITPLSQGGSYSAEDDLFAGYAMVQLFPSERVEIVGGARFERSEVSVTTQPTVGENVTTRPTFTDVLPGVAVNISLDDRHVLRFAGSQTLSRPEYRELAPVQFREVLGGDNILGNPDLVRTLIRNADVRWEFYPRPTEVISIAAFGKWFDDPIEQVFLGTSGTRIISFLNAESGRNFGVELELRKNLDLLGESFRPWSFFGNATFMNSRVTVAGSQGLAALLNDDRAMVGQAPYVINTGLTWTSPSTRWSGSILYNVVGRRIFSVGESPLPNVFEEARNMVDVSLRFPVPGALSGRIDARNLLDASSQLTQGSVRKQFSRSGRQFAVGFSWIPSGS